MNSPKVGVATIISHQNKILIGKRITNNSVEWQLPGGLIKLGETPEDAIIREAFEETNLSISLNDIVAITDNHFNSKEHSLSIIFSSSCKNPATLFNKEANKCTEWIWEFWDNLPKPQFLPLQQLVDSGYNPSNKKNSPVLKNKSNNCFIF